MIIFKWNLIPSKAVDLGHVSMVLLIKPVNIIFSFLAFCQALLIVAYN